MGEAPQLLTLYFVLKLAIFLIATSRLLKIKLGETALCSDLSKHFPVFM